MKVLKDTHCALKKSEDRRRQLQRLNSCLTKEGKPWRGTLAGLFHSHCLSMSEREKDLKALHYRCLHC